MSVTCARCGTQNPDGNQYAEACGTPLSMATFQPVGSPASTAPAPAPASPPPGPPPPPGYQSPYYAASAVGPQPTVHRTPWILIISAIVALVLLMAGCGTAIAVLSNRVNGNQGSSSGILPSPSPVGSLKPTAAPSPTTASGGATASNKGETFILPRGWTIDSKDAESITVTNPKGDGSVT